MSNCFRGILRRGNGTRKRIVGGAALALFLGLAVFYAPRLYGGLTDTRSAWAIFDDPASYPNTYITKYTAAGKKISDFESSQDPTNGGTAVQPNAVDIASASPNPLSPGSAASVWFGYYDGGTPWDPDDPSTMNDDVLFFRLRVGADPSAGGTGFTQYHFNILLDVDDDGYKEYWLDLDGNFAGNGDDRLFLFYQNRNTQNITVAERETNLVNQWVARNDEDAGNVSHTRAIDTDPTDQPDKSQWFIDYQIPLTALKDLYGNQMVYPDTPIRIAYSTSASNVDPLQKDWMGYTPFGDLITPGTPSIRFSDETLVPDVEYYRVGENVYVVVTAQDANTDPNTFETLTVTVTDPTTGDTETLTLRETAADSGIFSNQGAATDPVSTPDTGDFGWITTVTTYSTVVEEDWTATYNSTTNTWSVSGSVSGLQTTAATAGTLYTSDNGQVSFIIYETDKAPDNGATITFSTYAADPLPTSDTAGGGADGTLRVNAGDWIRTRYTVSGENYDDWAQIYGPTVPIIRFTRADGTDAENYILTTDPNTSDPIYVTVDHAAANADPNNPDTIQVVVTGTNGDSETITLTETGDNTGVFRNTTALDSLEYIPPDTPTTENSTFEERIGAIATATYNYGGTDYIDVANILVENAGTVAFVNGTGLRDVEYYGDDDYVWIKVTDNNYGTTANDLVTTQDSAVVTSASSTFQTDGVAPGDQFAILTGSDAGIYTVLSVDSETQITLTQALTTSDTGVTFDAVRDTMTVTVTGPTGDSEVVTLRETDAYSHVFMNTINDLVTTQDSNVVTSAYYDFGANGVVAGDTFIILSGPDIGTYTVQSVSGHSVTLDQNLTTSRTDIIFAVGDGTEDSMLLQAQLTAGGTPTANDDALEANNRDTLTVTYTDSNPSGTLTDTAVFGANPTAAAIAAFGAACERGRVVVEWETASELGTAGFYLERRSGPGDAFERVNQGLVPGLLTAPQGGTYRLVDPSAEAGKAYTYRLVEVEFRGKKQIHGPYRVTVQAEPAAKRAAAAGAAKTDGLGPRGYARQARRLAAAEAAKPLARAPGLTDDPTRTAVGTRAKTAAAAKAAAAVPGARTAVKILVKERGVYYVSAADVAPMLGIPEFLTGNFIRNGVLSLTCQGQPVAYLPAKKGAGLYFYGEGINSIYTDTNVYWLEFANGLLMETAAGCGAAPNPALETFADTVHAEVNQYATTALFMDPEADFWLWDYVFIAPGDTTMATRDFPISVPDPGPVGTARLVVRLKGATATEANPDHHVAVAINGTPIGEATWDGTNPCVLDLTFGQQLLLPGNNTVTVQALLGAGVAYSVFYVDSFDLTYQRLYRAVGNSLLCRADGRTRVTIERFTERTIQVLDVTDPRRPVLIEDPTIERVNGTWQVGVPTAPGGAYFALTLGAVKSPAALVADVPSRLTWRGNKGDYVVIAPAVLREGAEALAAYRQAKRFATMVVDIQDIYDEFSFGIVDPRAIRGFLAMARNTWARPPRYAVLAGNGTYDYKDYLGFGDNLLPPLMLATDYGLFASDALFAPNGDIAIGRLPATSPAKMSALVAKIAGYERSAGGDWTKKVILAADKADPEAGAFPQDSDDLAGIVPQPYVVDRVYLSELTLAAGRAKLIAGLNDGAVLFNFVGHASISELGNTGLLTLADVGGLANGDRTPVVTAFTCLAGRFEVPGVLCLGKALLLKNGGGGIAFWGPSALSENNQAKALAVGFFRETFGHREAILGDAVRKASAADPPTALIYQLFGDPALQLKRPQ